MRKNTTLFALLGMLFSFAALAEAPAPKFARDYLEPFLKSREGLYLLKVNNNKLEITSGNQQRWLGKYQLTFDDKVTELPDSAPDLKTDRASSGGTAFTQIRGELKLPSNPSPDVLNVLRALFRADMILHPMMTPPGGRQQLTDAQVDVLNQLLGFRKQAQALSKPTKAVVI